MKSIYIVIIIHLQLSYYLEINNKIYIYMYERNRKITTVYCLNNKKKKKKEHIDFHFQSCLNSQMTIVNINYKILVKQS